MLTYNYATWGLTKAQTEELDRAHRKQLRKVTRNPFIKNKKLYKKTEETPLSEQMQQAPRSEQMQQARWRLLGLKLRLDLIHHVKKQLITTLIFQSVQRKLQATRTTLPIIMADDPRLA